MHLAEIIAARLDADFTKLQDQFHARESMTPTRFFVVDELLQTNMAKTIYDAFPNHRQFRRFDSFREKKSTSKDLSSLPSILSEITFAFQDQSVIDAVERITGITRQLPDPNLYAGGLSMMIEGDFLNPHIDNSHDKDRRNYRTANLLYYVSPNWTSASGGNFELWDAKITKPLEIVSRFNRLVLMETNATSWHSVNTVRVRQTRCCVSNYYFSPDPPGGYHHFHITAFSARPEQKIRRLVAAVDSTLRTTLRQVVKGGMGKEDLLK